MDQSDNGLHPAYEAACAAARLVSHRLGDVFDAATGMIGSLQTERDYLKGEVVRLRNALVLAHSCATLRPDGTCNGCFVSKALGGGK